MATQAPSGKGKKGKKGKQKQKGGGKGQGKQKNTKKTKKGDDGPKDDTPPSLLEHHMNNKPKEDTPSSRDEDIARFQNEAAVLEKNIREITTQIEADKRARQGLKNRRQESYEAMNAARDILQAKKADKDKVYQRIQQYRNSRNSLRGDRSNRKGGKRSFRTIAELNAAIAKLERDMQTEVLSLKQEKAKIREMKELSKMRPEVQKISRQNEVLQEFTENSKEQHETDQDAYTVLKKAVQDAYTIQQGKYELFQEAVEADTDLNDSIEASIQLRKQKYLDQKTIRARISERKRDYQKSQRDVQRWDQQSRKLKRDVDFYNRRQQREEADRRRAEKLREYQTQADNDREEEVQQDVKREEVQQRQRDKRRAERDDTSPKGKDGPRPPRTTRPPRERKAREPRRREAQVHPAPKVVLEKEKHQLREVITYVKTLLPNTGEGDAAESMFGASPGGARVNVHKGFSSKKHDGFQPFKSTKRDDDFFGQDLFSNNRSKKKSKRKKKKKTKNVFFVQSHTPPTVMLAFKELKRWLSNNGCATEISLPMKPAEAEQCIKSLTAVEKFIVDWDPSKPKQKKPADPKPEEPTEQPTEPAAAEAAPEQSEAQPEAEPEQIDEQPTEDAAATEQTTTQPESLPSAPAPDVEPTSQAADEPSESQQGAADATEPSGGDEEAAADVEATPVSQEPEPTSQSQPEAAKAQPEDETAKEPGPVDTKPDQSDTTTPVHKDDAAPAQATNENQDDEDEDSDDDEEDESSDGVEVMESMVI